MRTATFLAVPLICASLLGISQAEATQGLLGAPERLILVEPEDRPSIAVAAKAEVTAKPDLATLELAIASTESKLQRAFEKNTELSNRILAALKHRAVKPEDVQTRAYQITPIYDGKRKPVRYTVTHQIAAKVRSFETLGPILDDVVDEEGIEIRQIRFSVEDPYKLEQSARIKAAQLAREKANDLAANAGAKLGRVLKLSEDTAWPGPIVMREQHLTAFVEKISQERYAAPPELAPGTLTFSVTCKAEYALES